MAAGLKIPANPFVYIEYFGCIEIIGNLPNNKVAASSASVSDQKH